ncbi:MAG: acyclic terpene utilization AtuA family protein [Magnetovibrio sp.]|nr:acyclic terpene utilization AtuA family protein [Magnetovibrio sp.]
MACSGMVGYGFTEDAFRRGLGLGVEMIGCDAGSMDPGPYYLGTATPFVSEMATRRDLRIMLEGARAAGVPMIVGSAGGGGSDAQLAWTRRLIEEIAGEAGLSFRMAVIGAEPDRDFLTERVLAGKTAPLGPIQPLTAGTVGEAARIVAMMGVEPLQAALDGGAEVIVAGRCSDAAIYAALPLMRGHDAGLAWHLGKIVECGAQVIEPRVGQDCIVGTIGDGYFEVEPGHQDKRCTRTRVAAHTLYENPSPSELKEPSGVLDSSDAVFEQVDERTVRVSGSRFHPADRYTVKLEGVRREGVRTVFVAGVRDPVLIGQFEDFARSCRERAGNDVAALGISPDSYRINLRVYGGSAVMGEREPDAGADPNELCVVADVIADDETASRAVLAKVRYSMLHTDFPGRLCISGNLAFPFSPSDMAVGEVFDFSVWHTVELDDPLGPFPIEMMEVR